MPELPGAHIPYRIQALQVEHLRRYAALAPGNLKPKAAQEAMQPALAHETSPYSVKLTQQGFNPLQEP